MNGLERRMTYRVTGEWVGLKRKKLFPSIDFLHPNTFSVDWNECVLVRLLNSWTPPGGDSLEFEFIGGSFRNDAPVLAAGARVSSVPDESLLSLSSPCLQMLFERQTAVIYGGCRPWRSSGAIYFRAIAVPFSDNCGELKYGLGAFSHKISNEAVSPENAKTEFLEFCNGAWLPLEDLADPASIPAA
jgi:hypothetical protein